MDAAALDILLDEDFIAIGPRGIGLSRQQWLDRYRSGDLKNDEFDWQQVNVRANGILPSQNAPGFSQRYEGAIVDGDNTFIGKRELS